MIPEHYLSTERFYEEETAETAEDFILPDYMAEVQRVLGVTAAVTLDDAFLEGDFLEAEGDVIYTVLYQSSDKGLASAPLTSRYSCRVPIRRGEGDGFGVEDVTFLKSAENVVCRVLSPRKLSLSAKVHLQCFSLGCTDGGHRIEAEEEDVSTVICRSREVPVTEVKNVRKTASASGNVREREGTRVISCTGHVCVQDVKILPANGEIRVTGEASVQFLLASPDGSYIRLRDRCPTEDTLRLEALRSLGSVRGEKDRPPEGFASAVCAALEVTCGDNGEIGWQMEYDLDCSAAMPGMRLITDDAYSTAYRENCTFRTTEAVSLGRCSTGRLTVTGEKQLRGGDMRYICGFGRAVFQNGEIRDGRLILTGSAVLTGVLADNGEVVTEECTVPLRYECEAGHTDGAVSCRCGITLFDIGGRVDGDMLYMTAESAFHGICLLKHPETTLESVSLKDAERLPEKRPAVTIYTPDVEDTDWTVQKRYRVREEAIRKTGQRYLIQME
ncbi:MAG: hypothetical protein E7658_01795 [Ruminococcaceae bacterium]|nr:hypothetical protein [Oscillospiraceae bacterium]